MTPIKPLSAIIASVVIITSVSPAHASGCELYCDSKAPGFIRNCRAADVGEDDCDSAWGVARQQCLDTQCSLEVEVPDRDQLILLAELMVPEILGPQFEIIEMNPHYWDTTTAEPGTLVFTCRSNDDQSRPAFLEVGASLDFPPVLSYGFDGVPAADALFDLAVARLTDAFGPAGYRLERQFLSAAHPILEFTDGYQNFYFMVATDSVSRNFSLVDDPDADQDLLEIRRQANRRMWADTLEHYLY